MSEGQRDENAPGAEPDGPAAAIFDLGYKRYVGTRRPQSSRWRVIVLNLLATSWRGWWRMKIWIIGAILTTVGIGVPMYISRDRIFEQMVSRGTAINWADALVPMAFQFFQWFAFVLGATIAATQVARDTRAGAFEFYFSRPVRPIDYVLGKLAGTTLIMAMAVAAGPILLALFRVGLSHDFDEVIASLDVVPRAGLVGILAALAYASVALAMSTLSSRSRITVAVWVVFYFMIGGIFEGIAYGTGIGDLAVLNMPKAVVGLAYGVFDVTIRFQPLPSPEASAAALIAYSVAGIWFLHHRVARAQRAGLGGG